MFKRELGNSGIEASVVAFGAWAIGGWKWGGTDAAASVDAIHASLDAGVNFIDTAPVYGFGLSEELVGRAMSGRAREDVVIATKCGLRWDLESENLHAESEGKRIHRTCQPESLEIELASSLERLKTDYIDLYQTHWPDPATPIESVVDTFERMRESGRIRAWGFCNAAPEHLATAAASGHLSTDQERYSLLDREQDDVNLPLVQEHELAFLAYSPIAQGLLSGRIDSKREFVSDDKRHNHPRFAPKVLDAVQAVLAPVKSLARDRGLSTEQIVLAWTLAQPGVSHVLVGTRSREQAEINAVVGTLELDAEELGVVDHAAAAWPGFDALA